MQNLQHVKDLFFDNSNLLDAFKFVRKLNANQAQRLSYEIDANAFWSQKGLIGRS